MEPHDVHAQNYDGVSAYFNLPHLATHDAAGAPRLALQVAGEDVTGARAFHALPAFDNYLRRTYPVEIYNRAAARSPGRRMPPNPGSS